MRLIICSINNKILLKTFFIFIKVLKNRFYFFLFLGKEECAMQIKHNAVNTRSIAKDVLRKLIIVIAAVVLFSGISSFFYKS